MEAQRPFVTLSYAQSADGRIATTGGRAERISGNESSAYTHRLRRDNQAIMVGIGTVLADDPLLTCRLGEECPSPVRIVLDAQLRLPAVSQIAATAKSHRTIVFCAPGAPQDRRAVLEGMGIEVLETEPEEHDPRLSGTERQEKAGGPDESDPDIEAGRAPESRLQEKARLSLTAVLDMLGYLGFGSLFVEGGAALITSFFDRNLVDRLCIIASPLIIGRGTEAVGDLRVRELTQARRGRTSSVRQLGEDVVWEIDFDRGKDGETREDGKAGQHGQAGEQDSEQAGDQSGDLASALYFTGPHTVALRGERLEGRDGELLIRSRVIGISHGTESHLYRGTFPGGDVRDGIAGIGGHMEYPLKYGYMNAGITPGGEKVFAFYPHQDRFYYPQRELVYFPDSARFEDIVLYPSVETAYTIVLDAAPLPGERVLVIGQGMIGLLVSEILTAGWGPALHAAALEPDPYRRRLGSELGIPAEDPSGLATNELRGMVRELFGGYLPDAVIHVSGSEEGLQQAVDAADFETRIIEASWHGNRPVRLDLGEEFHRNRVRIISSQVSTLSSKLGPRWSRSRRTAEVMQWVRRIEPSKYITDRFPLSEAQTAYRTIFGSGSEDEAPDGRVLQAVLVPDSEYNGGGTMEADGSIEPGGTHPPERST